MGNIIFGPINSRRFGKSLGIDLSPDKKQCNYDCLYCELQPAATMQTYTDVIEVVEIITAINEALEIYDDIDVLTITANGEPTLYPHLTELIKEINVIKADTKTLILSNASTIDDPAIQQALMSIDIIKLSLDCASQKCLHKIDRLHKGIDVENIKKGMLEFRQRSSNPIIIEILVVSGVNDKPEHIDELNEFLLELKPDRIDLGTIDRPPAYGAKPVDYDKLRALSMIFDPSLSVHITQRKNIQSSPSPYTKDQIKSTLHKRPLSDEDIDILFDNKSKERLKELMKNRQIEKVENNGVYFYKNY